VIPIYAFLQFAKIIVDIIIQNENNKIRQCLNVCVVIVDNLFGIWIKLGNINTLGTVWIIISVLSTALATICDIKHVIETRAETLPIKRLKWIFVFLLIAKIIVIIMFQKEKNNILQCLNVCVGIAKYFFEKWAVQRDYVSAARNDLLAEP